MHFATTWPLLYGGLGTLLCESTILEMIFLGLYPGGTPVVRLWFCPGHEGYLEVLQEQAGNWSACRDNFTDVLDFIGWYGSISHRTLGMSKWDAYKQAPAYDELRENVSRCSWRSTIKDQPRSAII